MTKTSKLILIATIAAGMASPVLAQSWGSGHNAFGMVPHYDGAYSHAVNGGGSTGYNADIGKKTN